MLRALLLTALVVFCIPTTAQQALHHKANQTPKATVAQPLKAYHKATPLTGEEPAKGKYTPTNRNRKSDVGVEIGTTRYDLQSNSSICRRVLNEGNGKVHAMWTMALQDDFGDRGTGYNISSDSGDSWGAAPSSRLEGISTGWPNIGKTESGRLFSITHSGSGIHFVYQDEEGGAWTDVTVGVNLGDTDGVWARAATSGNTIHAIIARQGGSFGSGVDGGILYFRSKDAGDTWEGPTDIEPGMADIFATGGGDTYAIDAQGDNVAFVMGDFGDQTAMYKSADGGDTWTRTLVVPTNDPFLMGQMDPTAVSNGHYALILDDNGVAHIWYNRMFVFREADSDAATLFILDDSAGIMYWNEDMGANPPVLIGETVRQDYDGDGETTVDDGVIALRGYRFGLVSQPSAGVDAAGNLYLAYSTMRDGALQEGSAGTRIYRDIYIIKSTDGGATWDGPLNISDDATTEDVYPHLARLVDDHVHLVFQSDEFAGTNLQSDNGHESIVDNSIRYVKIPVGDIVDPSESDETLPLSFQAAFSFTNSTIENCEPDFSVFFAGHAIDYPDGDVTDKVVNVGVDVSQPSDEAGFWVFDITDEAGNTRFDSLILGAEDANGEFIPNPVTVLADDEGPFIFPEPFGGFFTDNAGDIFFTTFFGLFDTVDVIVNTMYEDLGAIVVDPPGSNFNAPDYGNVYGCAPTLTVDNPVDVNTLGTYVVTYTATDINGNTQVDVSTAEAIDGIDRVVNVIEEDTQSPFIVLTSDANGDVDTVRVEVGSVASWADPGLLVFDNVDLIIDDENISISIVNESGATVNEVDVETTGTFVVTYAAADAAGNATSADRVVIVADTQPPVISLTPPPTVAVPCGSSYNERGFTALDNVDGIISSNVVISFVSLATNPPTAIDAIPNCTGNYAVTYNVTDSNGNAAAEVRRTVVVTGECMDNCPGTIATTDCSLVSVNLTDGNEIKTDMGQSDLSGEYTVIYDGGDVTGSTSLNTDNVDFTKSGPYTATVNYEGCLVDVAINVLFTVGIEDAIIASGVNVYPNPTNGVVNVAFNLDNEAVSITVFNILGEQVGTAQQITANQQVVNLDLSNHPTGIYFIQMTTDEGSYTQKVVLDK